MRVPSFLFILFVTFAWPACGTESLGPTDEEQAILDSFAGAHLVIDSPLSPSIFIVGEPMALAASVVNANGERLEFSDITWSSDLREASIGTGEAVDVFLDSGIHGIRAEALLPNGDRLETIHGGVRVQSGVTGIYAGQIEITLSGDFNDTPISASCLGGLNFVVGVAGDVLGGDGRCTIDPIVIDSFDVDYSVTADLEGASADGEVQISLGPFPVPMDWTGQFDREGTLRGDFDGASFMFDISGSLEARRLSPYTDL